MKINSKVFDQFPILKTERLTLREIKLSDVHKIFEMRANGRVNQFIARDNMNNLNSSIEIVKKINLAYKNRQGIGWAGVLRENENIIGTCGFNQIDFPNQRAEIGGELSVDYWGKNIALEAVTAIVKFGFLQMKLHTIEAKVSPDNRGAIFILEKIGFKKEAHFVDRIYHNGVFSDMAIYSILKTKGNYS